MPPAAGGEGDPLRLLAATAGVASALLCCREGLLSPVVLLRGTLPLREAVGGRPPPPPALACRNSRCSAASAWLYAICRVRRRVK